MKASITVKNPVVSDVFDDWSGGAVIDLFDEENPNGGIDLQLHLVLDYNDSSGHAVADFVTVLLEKAGISHYEFKLKTEVKPVASWRTAKDGGSTDDPLGYHVYEEIPLEYVDLY